MRRGAARLVALDGLFLPLQYMPRDYYTKRPRGFAFLEFRDEATALEAKSDMDRAELGGRQISVIFAEERRKSPHEMRRRDDRPPPPRFNNGTLQVRPCAISHTCVGVLMGYIRF